MKVFLRYKYPVMFVWLPLVIYPCPFCVLSCLGNVLVQVKTKLWIFVDFSLPKLRKIPDFDVHLKIHFVILQLPWDDYVGRPAQAILFWFGWCFKCWLNLYFVLVASVEFWKARIPVWCPCKSCLRGDRCAGTLGLSCGIWAGHILNPQWAPLCCWSNKKYISE